MVAYGHIYGLAFSSRHGGVDFGRCNFENAVGYVAIEPHGEQCFGTFVSECLDPDLLIRKLCRRYCAEGGELDITFLESGKCSHRREGEVGAFRSRKNVHLDVAQIETVPVPYLDVAGLRDVLRHVAQNPTAVGHVHVLVYGDFEDVDAQDVEAVVYHGAVVAGHTRIDGVVARLHTFRLEIDAKLAVFIRNSRQDSSRAHHGNADVNVQVGNRGVVEVGHRAVNRDHRVHGIDVLVDIGVELVDVGKVARQSDGLGEFSAAHDEGGIV